MPSGTIDPAIDYVAEVADATSSQWPTIAAADAHAVKVSALLRDTLREFTSGDVDVVVFGSLARREWTSGSDVDWTMLIDGQAAIEHRSAAREIEDTLAKTTYEGAPLKPPGGEGIFGNMAFSHEILHHIGGQADTNRNTTQRILLLLEATALRNGSDDELSGPFARLVRQILGRYLLSDSNFHIQADEDSRIPRFLLNDIVRYWRTMCVDFAYKDWEQAGKRWAIRNIKLRTSRKLLFFAGMLTVFSCYENPALRRDKADQSDYLLKLQEHLLSFVHSTPLNIFAWTMQELKLEEPCRDFLDQYEEFLSQMNDRAVRDYLGTLSEEQVYSDETFLHLRDISHRLQAILKNVCFEIDSALREFTHEYGVF